MLGRAATVAIALAVLFGPADGSAQRRRRARDPAALARQHFYDASILYENGNFEGAIVEFEAAYEADPRAVIRFNLAQCYRGLNRYIEAIAEYQRYLSEAGDMPAERRALVRSTINELRRLIAPITLEVEPAGAEVRIDGRTIGTAPLNGAVPLAAGRRVLEVIAEGHVTLRDDIVVTARRARTIHVRLAPRETAATLRITSRPPRAQVRIDGLDVGPAPVERLLSAGGHVIEATAPDHEPYRVPVDLADNQTLDLLTELRPIQPAPFYTEWWFWTGIGVAVAGLIILTYALWPASELSAEPGSTAPGVVYALTGSF